MTCPRRRSAFSLVELLTVVAIIALIIAMLLPSLLKSRVAVCQMLCANNLHQLHMAYGSHKTDANRGGEYLSPFAWQTYLRPYLSDSSAYFCCEQGRASPGGPGGSRPIDPPGNAAQSLYLKVFNAYPGGYLYDMAIEEGPLCRRVDRHMTDAEIDRLWVGHANAVSGRDKIKQYRDQLPASVYSYLLCFEDLRPDGGDRDYEDVILQVDELDTGGIRLTYRYDGAGYKFDLMQGDKVIWPEMDNGGKTRPGAAGTYGDDGQFVPGQGANVVVDASPTSYGMSTAAASMQKGGRNVVLMLDYTRVAAKGIAADGWDPWNDWLNPDGVYRFARHWSQANVLFAGGNVNLMHPDRINPAISTLRKQYWEPKE